jgi:thiamine biosynthesis lipoprotein
MPALGFAAAVDLSPRASGWLGVFQAMASPCEVHVAGADRATAERVAVIVAAEARRIEAKFSRYRRGNVVDAINGARGRTVGVDEETARLIDYAEQLFELSDGKFDITSGVLRRAWCFDGSDRVPSPAAVDALLAKVGWDKVRWRSPALTLADGMEIDFGGIGKEYAVDRAAALVRPLTSRCLLNFGGDLLALGPQGEGTPWRVGIESLAADGRAAVELDLDVGALATSGDARRFLHKNGRRYSHILDPTTGWPVAGAPRSVTVAAPTCTQAGMLATLALLRGPDAEEFLVAQGVRHWELR